MALARFLVDKSALSRAGDSQIAADFDALLHAQLLALCGVAALEVLYSARNGADHLRMHDELTSAFEWLPTEDDDFRRAMEVQGLLATTGRHRAVSVPDLLIAATAERHGVAVLHYDADFDLIAEVTGQPVRWVSPRGSIA
jgi:predicted nucleic acid-binding protein